MYFRLFLCSDIQVFSSLFVTKVNSNNVNAFGDENGGGSVGMVDGTTFVRYMSTDGNKLCGAGYPLPKSLPQVALQVGGGQSKPAKLASSLP